MTEPQDSTGAQASSLPDLTPGQYYDLGHRAAEVLAGHISSEEAVRLADECREGAQPQLTPWWMGLADELFNIARRS